MRVRHPEGYKIIRRKRAVVFFFSWNTPILRFLAIALYSVNNIVAAAVFSTFTGTLAKELEFQ
jgi:hypothetical protein